MTKKRIQKIESEIKYEMSIGLGLNSRSWQKQLGVLISAKEAKEYLSLLSTRITPKRVDEIVESVKEHVDEANAKFYPQEITAYFAELVAARIKSELMRRSK